MGRLPPGRERSVSGCDGATGEVVPNRVAEGCAAFPGVGACCETDERRTGDAGTGAMVRMMTRSLPCEAGGLETLAAFVGTVCIGAACGGTAFACGLISRDES